MSKAKFFFLVLVFIEIIIGNKLMAADNIPKNILRISPGFGEVQTNTVKKDIEGYEPLHSYGGGQFIASVEWLYPFKWFNAGLGFGYYDRHGNNYQGISNVNSYSDKFYSVFELPTKKEKQTSASFILQAGMVKGVFSDKYHFTGGGGIMLHFLNKERSFKAYDFSILLFVEHNGEGKLTQVKVPTERNPYTLPHPVTVVYEDYKYTTLSFNIILVCQRTFFTK